jgi:hypothetical protein
MSNVSKDMMTLLDENKDKTKMDSDFYLKMSNLLLEHSKESKSKKYEISYIMTFFIDNIENDEPDDEYELCQKVFKKTVYGGLVFVMEEISSGRGIEFNNMDGCEYMTNNDEQSIQELWKYGEYEHCSTVYYKKYTLVDIKEIKI